jgi:CHAD domain-containing protein
MTKHVRRAGKRFGKRIDAALAGGSDAALHRARKAAKRARYAGEVVSPVLGKKAGKFTKRMKKVQSALGKHQDTVIAREVERELGMSAQLAGENAYTYGLLHGREAQAAEGYQRRARRAWRKAARPRHRRWLG